MDKGNDKNDDADSFLHDTSGHTNCLPNFEILDAVVPEKF